MSEKNVNVQNNTGEVNVYLYGHSDATIDPNTEYKIDSVINELLNILASEGGDLKIENRKPTAETIVKINHNNLQSTKNIIKQYLLYSEKIESAFESIEKTIPFGKTTILGKLKSVYYETLDAFKIDYFGNEMYIEQIRDNADKIVNDIRRKIISISYSSQNKPKYREYLEIGVDVIVAHSFIECVIMEKPDNVT